MRDVWLVARFEIGRAIRTWRALALLAIYAVMYGGGSWVFTRLVGELENNVADALGVGHTRTPGAMLAQLAGSEAWRRTVQGMVGVDHLVEAWVASPPLAIFALWFGFGVLPFFAASASAESVAIDVQSRAIRYEAQRTGRLELALGRFLGQLAVASAACVTGAVTVWVVGLIYMVGNDPLGLGLALAAVGLRSWAFGVPFVAVGVTVSLVTSSPAWARVLAVLGTAGSWVAYGWALYEQDVRGAAWADLVLQVLPQGWIFGLWEPGLGWLPSAAACALLGTIALTAGYLRFAQRDL